MEDPGRRGQAPVKPQYVINDRVTKDGSPERRQDDGPPTKKARGQNKQRPREARLPRQEKLCPSVAQGETCSYGEACQYLHDVARYLATKQPDVDRDCHLFTAYGCCHYGVTCRFASSHLVDGANRINETLHRAMKDSMPKLQEKNSLPKTVQVDLWKRKYNFEASDAALKATARPTPAASERADSLNTETQPSRVGAREVKQIDWRGKLYLAPLTTIGTLPFRRVCKRLGADVTCGEMALCTNLLQGQMSEWALLRRHADEDVFGVQVCGAFPDTMTKCAQLLTEVADVDFIDINVGCPIDLIYRKGAGCGLMNRVNKFEGVVRGMRAVMDDIPLTVKLRTGIHEKRNTAHTLIEKIKEWGGVSLVTLHGRSREQRYVKLADWDYVQECASIAQPLPLFGCGDVLSFEDYYSHLDGSVSGVMLARGAMIKPWIFTEIKERRTWDISSQERLQILREYSNHGLEHWGSDGEGVERTRRFLLEWLSFLHRYIPAGILETLPQRMNQRPPLYRGRDDLETLMASPNSNDWIKITELLLGPVPDGFSFLPKHKANSYS